MSKNLVPYNDNKGITRFDQSVRTVASYVDQAVTFVDTQSYAASMWGKLKELEADLILERELGLSPRRKKR